ncbi:putative DNA binding domain-containing protein [Pseudomonas sp. B21-023]|uniref:RNA-binding domain-containing protein n=1 Tax=Pseudomonas sp. B21-023 TaxID=2895477 RepID=UPI00215E235D|nr:RNA-binding domain-containing protein [Pseudomonas sp. B21-023]UVM15575.1 putative DNA binding domain-containing protein [Pseudomonas sp. B21-023]
MNVNDLKKQVYGLIQAGTLSETVLKLLIPDNNVTPFECELWDYKEAYAESSHDYTKTARAIASLYNTYGGYLLYGIKETIKDTQYELIGVKEGTIDIQKLKGQLDKYFGHRLNINIIELSYGSPVVTIGLLHVPKRPEQLHTISANKIANDSKNKVIFTEGATLYRDGDKCKQAVTHADFEFLTSSRDLLALLDGKFVKKINLLDHNLPDRNFICPNFVGRVEIIQKLWAWLSDEFQYAKVLAGEGGKGKTSIAYEFCQLITSTGAPIFDQIIWLTAKTQQFKAGADDFINTPETHYNDLESLLITICQKTGTLDAELDDLGITQLKRLARQNLENYPSFIVIDDVDSTDVDEQKRIMETAREIGGSKSKILLTTRSNVSYSSDTAIEVPGLAGEEYEQYIDELKSSMRFDDITSKTVRKLEKASEGSPLFTESILRLCRVGYSIDDAISEWHGKKGEAVRSAALRREIHQLSPEARRVLLTIAFIGSCSLSELRHYTELEQPLIEDAIPELGRLFLLQSASFIESEPRFKCSQSISNLTISLKDEIVPNAERYLGTLKGRAQALKANSSRNNQVSVGEAIRQSVALLKEKEYSKARATIKSVLKKQQYKNNPDLLLAYAQIESMDPLADINSVRSSFRDAYTHGQRKELLFDLWFQVEARTGSKSELVDVCRSAVIDAKLQTPKWLNRSAEAKFLLAHKMGSAARKHELLASSYDDISQAIKKSHGELKHQLKDLSIKILDALWGSLQIDREDFKAFKAMHKAIRAGDIRSINYYRLSEAACAIHTIYHSENTTARRKKEILPDYLECQRAIADVIELIDDTRYDVLNTLGDTKNRFILSA